MQLFRIHQTAVTSVTEISMPILNLYNMISSSITIKLSQKVVFKPWQRYCCGVMDYKQSLAMSSKPMYPRDLAR